MFGDRLTAEGQLLLNELVHLVIGVLCGVMVWGMVADWMTSLVLIGTGVVAGTLMIVAFVLEKQLRDQLQTAENCRCSAYHGDGS